MKPRVSKLTITDNPISVLEFSLEEIAGLLQLEDGTHCDEARVMAEEKLEDVCAKLRDLRRIESTLRRLVADCCAAEGTITCPLIAALTSR